MLKKRLIGVITVIDNWAVQSFGYGRYLPLGKPEFLAENLDRWEVDEILVLCIDRSRLNMGPNLELLTRLNRLGLSTPLSYGGGVCTVEHAAAVIQRGAERLCIDSALHVNQYNIIGDIAQLIGSQAMIAALPLKAEGDNLGWYNYLTKKHVVWDEANSSFLKNNFSEILLIDHVHEGYSNQFDMNLVNNFPMEDISLIVFGGLSESEQLASLLSLRGVSAVAVGNSLSYSEHAVQKLKSQLATFSLREASYAASH